MTLSSASTSMMIGRILRTVRPWTVSRRFRIHALEQPRCTCSLILWTLASKPPTSRLSPEWVEFIRSCRRDIASELAGLEGEKAEHRQRSGGNCSPASSSSTVSGGRRRAAHAWAWRHRTADDCWHPCRRPVLASECAHSGNPRENSLIVRQALSEYDEAHPSKHGE